VNENRLQNWRWGHLFFYIFYFRNKFSFSFFCPFLDLAGGGPSIFTIKANGLPLSFLCLREIPSTDPDFRNDELTCDQGPIRSLEAGRIGLFDAELSSSEPGSPARAGRNGTETPGRPMWSGTGQVPRAWGCIPGTHRFGQPTSYVLPARRRANGRRLAIATVPKSSPPAAPTPALDLYVRQHASP